MRVLFKESEFEPRRKSVQLMLVMIALFLLSGVVVDARVYPYFAGQFMLYRLATASILVIGWVVASKVKRSWQLRVVGHLGLIISVLATELMIYKARDPASSYYGGVIVILVGAAVLLRWQRRDSLINISICVLSFFALMYISGLTYRGGIVPSFFVLMVGVVAVLASCYNDAGRFREFCLVRAVQDTNQQLRAMDETKARFFANISHELRTPLTLILGPLENLRVHNKYRKDTLLIEHVDMMEDNAMRLLRLINDILDLVKLDSEESPPRPELVDVEAFVLGITKNLGPIATLKDINFSCYCDVVEKKTVWLDRDRLEKIVLNLAVNAVKFTPLGGVITLGAVTHDGKLTLTVSDSGQGMSQDALANVFVRFWQADMSAKRKHRGAGIGLALVKSLTESMHGEIFVASELEKGSTFKVVIPIPEPEKGEIVSERDGRSELDVLERFNEQSKLRGVLRASGERLDLFVDKGEDNVAVRKSDGGPQKRILIAEDEDAMRAFIVRQLDGYDVIEAHDGAEALRLAKEVKPDLMVVDYMMPGFDGVELTARLRAEPSTARIPIILLTAQAGAAARLGALEAGVNDFLTKPFSSDELLARVRNLLSSSDFETQLAENNVRLESAYDQLKEQGVILMQTEKLSSLGRMSAGIVHEINNPLNYTNTALYALKTFERQLPDDEREDFLDVLGDAQEGVGRVVEIVKSLRSFTRGDVAKMDDVVLAEVIESSRKLCAPSMAGVQFESDIALEFVINGNEVQLCQLFVNLFQNAIRAIQVQDEGDRGESKITVSCDICREDELQVKIRDTGCGISKEDIERVFDPFFTKNDVGEGMGLGLSITYRIIEQHEARIEVDSELGEFTEFKVYFPQKSKE